MPVYKTPGVYVEEISTLPPSVAEVSTAVPAFIGYTEKGHTGDGPVIGRVNTLLEYEQRFGGPKPAVFSVNTDADDRVTGVARVLPTGITADPQFLMYYAVSHYFKNGGGSCYVVSVGHYPATLDEKQLDAGLKLLEQEDEPTLILLTDAVNLDAAQYHALCQSALAQCKKLGDRFAILDVKRNAAKNTADADAFRNGFSSDALAYGAAYYPYLETTLSYAYEESGVTIYPPWSKEIAKNAIRVTFAELGGATPSVTVTHDAAAAAPSFSVTGRVLTVTVAPTDTGAEIAAAWTAWKSDTTHNALGFNVIQDGDGKGVLVAGATPLGEVRTLAAIKSTNTALYNQVKARLAAERVVLPPSAAVAGIYASVDRDRGVWKAPANASVSAVIGPVTKITNDDQEGLNVDPTAGKSINAIRAFTGKGTLVWGARTLAGNDNEWRYVSVRRLFNMIEESARKATSFAVFEPNDMTTWLKVKGMIESFLYGLWERGALAGPAPASAYFVNVGLGKTMTTQDVLEGRMIVEIGVAAVRPAEFIILRFTHKLQEA